MSLTLIEDLAYALKKGKENRERAIVFLGAGASKTGGIPLAGELMTEILNRYAEVPAVKRLSPDDKKSYTKVMASLGPVDRKALFKEYIDKASINASHIYLAHMMKEGYIDFVFTVNFDNLMQRALGLFNMYPAVYDMAMLKGMTTAPFESPGLVYLHGQYHGFNLLNTEAEFKSVSGLLKRCFIPVANRPWILVGYSGEDPVLDYINELGRFEHGLYWVCYNDKDPSERVSNSFFSTNDKNAFKVKGCDADSFFVKLHAELDLPQPPIIDTPFSYLRGLQESIVDIKGDELKKANERLNITKNWINQAITTYERPRTETILDKDKIELEKIKKNLIDVIITENYEQLAAFSVYNTDSAVNEYLAIGYNNWGVSLANLGRASTGAEAKDYFKEAIAKYEQAVSLKPDNADAYINWGNSLGDLGRASSGTEAIDYFKEAIAKYEQAVSLKPDNADAYYNWGISLGDLGRVPTDTETKDYFKESIAKYEQAISLKPDYANAYNNWGNSLGDLGRASTGTEAKDYFKEAIVKYEQAISLQPDHADAYYNWGNSLGDLGRASSGIEAKDYFKEAITKYEHVISLQPDYVNAYNNCCSTLSSLYNLLDQEEKNAALVKAMMMAQKAYALAGQCYNLSCTYALLNDATNAFKYLEEALQNGQITFTHLSGDKDWDHLRMHAEYLRLKEIYDKTD